MFICTAIDASNQCTSWLDLSTTNVSASDVNSFFVAALLLFATAWGFRLVLRLLLNRKG